MGKFKTSLKFLEKNNIFVSKILLLCFAISVSWLIIIIIIIKKLKLFKQLLVK